MNDLEKLVRAYLAELGLKPEVGTTISCSPRSIMLGDVQFKNQGVEMYLGLHVRLTPRKGVKKGRWMQELIFDGKDGAAQAAGGK